MAKNQHLTQRAPLTPRKPAPRRRIEDLPNRIREHREAIPKMSQERLAELANTTKQTIHKLEVGEIRLDLYWMDRLAPLLGVEPAELMPKNKTGTATVLLGGEAALAPRLEPMDRTDLIPIRSAARGGEEQEMFLEDGPLGHTQRPRSLLGVQGAYAIYMLGDSMEPRYRQGWLLHINPLKPPAKGRDVVVTKSDNVVMIKEFVGWDRGELVLRQLNPADAPLIRIPARDIRDCHLVVGCDMEG